MNLNSRLAILGSTGSVGRSAVEVVRHLGAPYAAVALTGHENINLLLEQAGALRPSSVVVTGTADRAKVEEQFAKFGCRAAFGPDALVDLVRQPGVEVVLSAIVGAAGLSAAFATVEAGKRLLLANKESLVIAGRLLIPAAKKSGALILPVDSEHSAIFQASLAGRADEIERVILTASGGPFRDWPPDKIDSATPADALKHPTWSMGRKISVDSATMFNKAAEIIEAAWLFDLRPDQIEVVIHRQSLVHSMVEFVDGSVIAQLCPPDMKSPIQHALTHPQRLTGSSARMDWRQSMTLDFQPPDAKKYPALEVAYDVARRGGTAGAAMNAANETAVEAFLAGRIRFGMIWRIVKEVVDKHPFSAEPTLDELLAADTLARTSAAGMI